MKVRNKEHGEGKNERNKGRKAEHLLQYEIAWLRFVYCGDLSRPSVLPDRESYVE
jgi:hypothetical protein